MSAHAHLKPYTSPGCDSGDEICALSPPVGPNGATPSIPASIILIDRQLDIVTPALHHTHVLDRVFGQLHARTGNKSRRSEHGQKTLQGQLPKAPMPKGPTRGCREEGGASGWAAAGAEAASGHSEGPAAQQEAVPQQQEQQSASVSDEQVYGLR